MAISIRSLPWSWLGTISQNMWQAKAPHFSPESRNICISRYKDLISGFIAICKPPWVSYPTHGDLLDWVFKISLSQKPARKTPQRCWQLQVWSGHRYEIRYDGGGAGKLKGSERSWKCVNSGSFHRGASVLVGIKIHTQHSINLTQRLSSGIN